MKIQNGTTPAPDRFRVRIDPRGPYLVYGAPPLVQQFLAGDDAGGDILYFQAGDSYSTEHEPTALCRCGESRGHPYCDGSHLKADWDPSLTASQEQLLSRVGVIEGPTLTLTDNEEYCAFARFCDARGRVWNLVGRSDDDSAREWTIRQANRCPAGRLHAWDKDSDTPFEPHYDPSLALIEDPQIGSSGPLWVRGGIAVERAEDGFVYEIRNRVTLCRCGQSSNKPYCNGAHASFKWQDGLNKTPTGERE